MGEHKHNPVIKFVNGHPGFTKLSKSERLTMKRKAKKKVLGESFKDQVKEG